MKKRMRITLTLLCATLLLALVACGNEMPPDTTEDVPTSNTESETEEETSLPQEDDMTEVLDEYIDFTVHVESGRDIRVLQLTDVQTISTDQKRHATRVSTNQKANTTLCYERYIRQVVERYQPDLILMTGDNTYGEFDDSGEQLLALIAFMDSFRIPWAPVFGNHDNESNMGVDWQCKQFENSEYCLFKQRTLTGNGNYTVGLVQDGTLKRVFYMLDSNGCSNMSAISLANGHSKTSVGFGEDQIAWYSQSMEELRFLYPDVKISMAFHIQLSVFEDAFRTYGYNSSTIYSNPICLDDSAAAQAVGDFGIIGRPLKSSWDTDHTVWNTVLRYGVDSVFVGHEHCNSSSILYEGVRLTYGQKSSTFDRYNLLQPDGTVLDSAETSAGEPIVGGTFITLSEADGSIADAGLCLYETEEDPTEAPPTFPNALPEGATVTVLDFGTPDLDPTVTTSTIKNSAATSVTDPTLLPEGYEGNVYGYNSDNIACIGIRLPQALNVERLSSLLVKMYVSDYTLTAGKEALLRIYNTSENSILSSATYTSLGGETNAWVYVDILDLVKAAPDLIRRGALLPFTLLFRFYGDTAGTVFFDSLIAVSEGDPFTFLPVDAPEIDYEIARGEIYYRHDAKDLDGLIGTHSGSFAAFATLEKTNYSVKFNLTPTAFDGTLTVYGYTNATDPQSGIGVNITAEKITVTKGNGKVSLKNGETHEIEVGFLPLFNGNTVYTFVRVDGKLVAWELVESFGKTVGNVALVSDTEGDTFEIS